MIPHIAIGLAWLAAPVGAQSVEYDVARCIVSTLGQEGCQAVLADTGVTGFESGAGCSVLTDLWLGEVPDPGTAFTAGALSELERSGPTGEAIAGFVSAAELLMCLYTAFESDNARYQAGQRARAAEQGRARQLQALAIRELQVRATSVYGAIQARDEPALIEPFADDATVSTPEGSSQSVRAWAQGWSQAWRAHPTVQVQARCGPSAVRTTTAMATCTYHAVMTRRSGRTTELEGTDVLHLQRHSDGWRIQRLEQRSARVTAEPARTGAVFVRAGVGLPVGAEAATPNLTTGLELVGRLGGLTGGLDPSAELGVGSGQYNLFSDAPVAFDVHARAGASVDLAPSEALRVAPTPWLGRRLAGPAGAAWIAGLDLEIGRTARRRGGALVARASTDLSGEASGSWAGQLMLSARLR